MSPTKPSLSGLTAELVDSLVQDSPQLRLGVERQTDGCLLVDAGIEAMGGLEAGRRIAEICLGGLGQVSFGGPLAIGGTVGDWPASVSVSTSDPVLACLGSQYAGWSLSHGEGKGAFRALGSGPGRALAGKEPLFDELDYHDCSDRACLVLEVDRRPPQPLVEKIARDCGVAPAGLTLILTPTRSLAGTVQILARVLEVALHKAHALGFDPHAICDGLGSVPLAPPSPDFITAMGRTNDAILFAGQVHLFVTGADAAARDLAERLPSSASRDYGRPFAEVFKAFDYDFFQIDPFLFSPACIRVTNLDSGHTFSAGRLDPDLLSVSFGLAP